MTRVDAPAVVSRAVAEKEASGERPLARDAVHLFVLSAFALAQPLFAVLAANSAFFAIRGSSRLDVLVFTVTALVAPPLVLAVCELSLGFLHEGARRMLHLVFVASLVAIACLIALKKTGVQSTLLVVAAAAVGLGAAAAYRSLPPARLFVTALSPAPVLFAILFVLHSPVAKLVLPDHTRVALGTVHSRTSVVVVVFDEFSGTTLMNRRLRVDATRFPSFAALARSSIWFRNATTAVPWTESAVPAILSARIPSKQALPIFRDYQQNLFTLFGGTYRLHVDDGETRLCPSILCAQSGAAGIKPGLGPLFSDLGVVFLHVLLPGQLERRLPSISGRWGDFLDRSGAASASGQTPAASEAARFERFLASIQQPDRPTLWYLHVVLPHAPWEYLPTGQRYPIGDETFVPGLSRDRWGDDPRLVRAAFQRYQLQVGFADRLLGRLVERLEEKGLYDRSLLVVTADHGVSFRPGEERRAVTAATIADIAFVPLFVKSPGERAGRVVDRAARTVDVVPTIAQLLHGRLGWPHDGRPALSEPPLRGTSVTIGGRRADGASLLADRADRLRYQTNLFGVGWSSVFRAGARLSLLGRSVGRSTPSSAERVIVDDAGRYRSVEPSAPIVPAYISGTLTGREARAGQELAVAVNGVIRGGATSYKVGGRFGFGAIVPPSSYRRGRNVIAVFRVDHGLRLVSLGGTSGGADYRIGSVGAREVLLSSRGRRLRVRPAAVQGRFDIVRQEEQAIRIRGWAAETKRRIRGEEVLVFAGRRFVYSTSTSVPRPDLGEKLRNAGFDFTLPLALLASGPKTTVRVFGVVGGVASEIGCPRPDGGIYHRAVRVRVTAATVATLLLPTACGGGGNAKPQSLPGPAQQLLTPADIGRFPPSSPAHALLAWWRSAQYADLSGYLDGFAAPLRLTLRSSAKTGPALNYFSGTIRNARPEIVNVSTVGSTATVYTILQYRQPVGSTRFITSTLPRAFGMVREGGRWRLTDDLFVESNVTPNLRRAGVPSG